LETDLGDVELFKIDGGGAQDKTVALDSVLAVGPSCHGEIKLTKQFAAE
jgi:hypothetical protein